MLSMVGPVQGDEASSAPLLDSSIQRLSLTGLDLPVFTSLPNEGVNQITTAVGGNTFDVNAAVGANAYYQHSTPITGQNTMVFNLEAGHFWNGHESLSHIATNSSNFIAGSESWGGASISDKYDRHATWAAMLIGGRQNGSPSTLFPQGIAYGTDLRSAAIASSWSGNAYALSFGLTLESFLTPYQAVFGTADVVNSSFGYSDATGTDALTVVTDAYSYQNSKTLYVASAGNSGPASNTVGAPGAGYNALTVGALGGANDYDTIATFSSRGPQSFGYQDENGAVVSVAGVRAVVDIVAPGESLVSAFYGGQTGGNNTSLAGSVDQGSVSNVYSNGIAGTSFSSPIVAGGASLLNSAAKTLPELSANSSATESMVIKALLLTGADKPSGWSNGLQMTAGENAHLQTTQSLDWNLGAGALNLATAFDLQIGGQIDVLGQQTGALGQVAADGWDYGNATVGTANDYEILGEIAAGTTMTTSLTWMRNRFFDFAVLEFADTAQADLNLSVWMLDAEGNFDQLIASSESDYNVVEHLSFTVPSTARYGIRVDYLGNTFDNTVGDVWGTGELLQDYGLAWSATPIPEPSLALLSSLGVLGLLFRRRAA
ncbi:MAG: S8 family serine peptidase [Luteolibacter sp.]